jgi:hypothetical protein
VATELLRREFTVDAPLGTTWQTFADVGAWPRWAPHLKHVDVSPPGLVGPDSEGTLHFQPAGQSRFRVTSYDEGMGWEWAGTALGLTIRYDHRLESDPAGTRLTWTVFEPGDDRSLRGRLFASFYARLVDRAIPRLQALMTSSSPGT